MVDSAAVKNAIHQLVNSHLQKVNQVERVPTYVHCGTACSTMMPPRIRFVPAAKLARRKGASIIPDPLWSNIEPDLHQHIDELRSALAQLEPPVGS